MLNSNVYTKYPAGNISTDAIMQLKMYTVFKFVNRLIFYLCLNVSLREQT